MRIDSAMIVVIRKSGAFPIRQFNSAIGFHQFNNTGFAGENLEPALQPWGQPFAHPENQIGFFKSSGFRWAKGIGMG